MLHRRRGFTLIELLLIVAIIGILASLAIAAYQTYTVRSQIEEGLRLATGAKAQILDAYAANGVAPANRAAAGMSPRASDSRGGLVSDVEIVDGRIDITFGGPAAHPDIVGRVLSVTPYETGDKLFAWRCGAAPPPRGSLLPGGAEHRAPTLESRYLPGDCR